MAGMSSDTIALIAMLATGFFIGVQLEKALVRQRRTEWRKKKGWDRQGDVATSPLAAKLGLAPEKTVPDAADQLRTVMKADFKAQPLLNKSEAAVQGNRQVGDRAAPRLAGDGAGQPGRNPAVRGQGRLRLHQFKARRPADRR